MSNWPTGWVPDMKIALDPTPFHQLATMSDYVSKYRT
jgi:hypothetical protein